MYLACLLLQVTVYQKRKAVALMNATDFKFTRSILSRISIFALNDYEGNMFY